MRLRKAGFGGCSSVTLDNQQPYTYNANIIAKPVLNSTVPQKLTVLWRSEQSSLFVEVGNLLRAQGIEVEICEWGKEFPADQDLISFIDLGEVPILQNVNGEDLAQFLRLIDSLQQCNVLWLMHSAQIRPRNPHAAQMLGLARTIRSELAMSFATFELENTGRETAEDIIKTMRKIQLSKDDSSELDPDMEYVRADGAVNVSRFHWVAVEKAMSETAKAPETRLLDIGTPGLLQTLHWTGQPLGELAPNEANVRMVAVGLNFKDVMIAMGIINARELLEKGTSAFGLEGTGYITKVGSEVTNVTVGDRVMLIGCESVGMATVIQRPANLCIKIPDQLSDEEAATMPVVYVTVLMFLVERWKLARGQSILIHSAAGGKNFFFPSI